MGLAAPFQPAAQSRGERAVAEPHPTRTTGKDGPSPRGPQRLLNPAPNLKFVRLVSEEQDAEMDRLLALDLVVMWPPAYPSVLPRTAELKSDGRAKLGRVRLCGESDFSHMNIRGGLSSDSFDWVVHDARLRRRRGYGQLVLK
jgi:hypothetical protein